MNKSRKKAARMDKALDTILLDLIGKTENELSVSMQDKAVHNAKLEIVDLFDRELNGQD